MGAAAELRTPRLLLRRPGEADREPLAALDADPVVMEHFPAPLTRVESDAFLERMRAQWDAEGWGMWAVERRDTGALIGITGLAPVRFAAPFRPLREVGWRLAAEHWGRGFATEAATAALDEAFGVLGWDEVVSFTAVGNTRSRAVMERLGMTRDPAEDFDHPALPEGHRLRRHVLHRVTATAWPARHG